jgi:hypothetical protein
LVAAALWSAVAIAAPRPVGAFFQTTTLEGVIPSEASGVWLAVSNVMPTFMVRLDSVPDTIAPFKVGPLPESLSPMFPDGLKGVIVTEFDDPSLAKQIGIFPGDVIIKVNTIHVADEEEYAAALKQAKSWFLVTVHRTSLALSKGRILKIRAQSEPIEAEGKTVMGPQKVEVRFLEAVLPIHDELEATRQSHEPFTPSDKDIEALSENWWKLPLPDPSAFVGGEHRVVAEQDYDSSLRQDPHMEGSSWAVVSKLKGNPFSGGGQVIVIHGFKGISAERMTGAIVESTIAQAPFPISIEFDGAFTMYKLADFSNKDAEYRAEQRAKESSGEDDDGKPIEVAPDIPDSVPAENSESDEKLAE